MGMGSFACRRLVSLPSSPSCPLLWRRRSRLVSGLRMWREWGVRPVTLRGMRRGNEGDCAWR
jgi:hypothetical protein